MARPPSGACASSSKWAARIPPSCWPTADFNSAVENVVNAAFFSTGQKCTATSRAIVEDAIYDKFVAALVERTKKAESRRRHAAGHRHRPCRRPGAARNGAEATSRSARRKPARPMSAAIASPAAGSPKAISSSRRSSPMSHGAMTIAQEEIFGPVLAVMRAKDFEDAMRIANNIPFGLSSSIQTTNLSRRIRVHLPRRGRPADRQSAERGRRVSASLRRHQGFQLRAQRTGPGGHGILQRLQNHLSEILSSCRHQDKSEP